MTSQGNFRFGDFTLDLGERQLRRDGKVVELSSRYFDALVLLVREQGSLVTRDRFLDDVWNGVPVTDEALSQCIKTLRRQLGDSAERPRFIQTVPKHGYRFIAPVEAGQAAQAAPPPRDRTGIDMMELLALAAAGMVGGGVAGTIGGIFYGLGGANQPLDAGMGATSVLLVLLTLTILVGLVGGLGVGLGLALALLRGGGAGWIVAGAALGGAIVGSVVKLFGIDTLNLLFGRAPAGITGGVEGAILGGAIALGAVLGGGIDAPSRRRPILGGGLAGALAGLAITAMGGRLMGGSLELVAHAFPGSRLRLDPVGRLFGEEHFGRISQMVSGSLEGLLFGGCVIAAIIFARREFVGQGVRPVQKLL